jgi:hypothetical protein
VFCCLCSNLWSRKGRRKCRWYARTLLMKWDTHSAYLSILNELKVEDRQGFKNFVHMSPFDLENLLKMVSPLVKLQDPTDISLLPTLWLIEMLQSLNIPRFHHYKPQETCMEWLKRPYTHAQVPEHKMFSLDERQQELCPIHVYDNWFYGT